MTEPTWDGTCWSDDNPVTDEEKHAYCKQRTGVCACFLSPSMYAAAELAGLDMRHFVKYKSMPPGKRKNVKSCDYDRPCMPGLNGKCTACNLNEG